MRLSFEFFPPRSETGKKQLQQTHRQLQQSRPDFFSVTYGAGGSTHSGTRDTVLDIQRSSGNAAAHIAFSSTTATEDSLLQLLNSYREAGVADIVALRGDQPAPTADNGQAATGQDRDKRRHAVKMVGFIRRHFGDSFKINVAAYPECHPEASSLRQDVQYLKAKLDAGADAAITQFFYNPDAWDNFRNLCEQAGIRQPIYPGIMPIFADLSITSMAERCGAEVPRWLQKQLAEHQEPESLSRFADDFIIGLCHKLLDSDAPGLHFYTLNRSQPTHNIVAALPDFTTPNTTAPMKQSSAQTDG